MATITLTGAFRIFSPLAGMAQAASFCFASSVVHQISRAGSWLALVGPIFIRSQIAWSCSVDTGLSR